MAIPGDGRQLKGKFNCAFVINKCIGISFREGEDSDRNETRDEVKQKLIPRIYDFISHPAGYVSQRLTGKYVVGVLIHFSNKKPILNAIAEEQKI